ncbi:hypothetical protein ACRZZB_001510 [Klebsiella oxytoca]|uniref:hypothetical protein n=1 Tax=Citrobacter sp. XY323 TaxID=2976537 RepID=UPI0021824592|nr:hypothetical protein [Citrobacter sp. XY323]MCS8551854.1 hypothetical protein [Citrobacter sp. XY323]
MEKVTDQYSPEIARHKLNAYFSGNFIMLDVIKRLQKSSLCVFAALCDGKTITTAGYEINADFSVKRASAVIHSLKLKNLPVSTNSVSTGSDVGGITNQAVFFISKEDLHSLKSEPEEIMRKCARLHAQHKRSHAQRDIARLCKEFGKEAILKLVNQAAANPKMPPDGMGTC